MYGNAEAIAAAARLAGDNAAAQRYSCLADTLRTLIRTRLWDADARFYEVRKPVGGAGGVVVGDSSAHVREEIGYLPWYFGAAADNGRDAAAWLQLVSDSGFCAPYGITTAEQRHPRFRSHGVGKCEWDGAVWPFASSQTLTAMANWLNDYRVRPMESAKMIDRGEQFWREVYFDNMKKYVESQSHRGRPYIGEYLDETTGAWLMGDRERSRYYNHSTFNDLIITGLCGLRPSAGDTIVVNPLLPADKWDYFCLDKVRYHGHDVTIVWDKDGNRYHVGVGLTLLVDGRRAASRKDIGELKAVLHE